MHLKLYCVLAYLYMFVLIAPVIDAHKILVIVPMNGKSHWNYMKNFINELLNRGNEVTCITTISMGDNKPTNYTEILIDPPFYKENLGKYSKITNSIFYLVFMPKIFSSFFSSQ